MHKTLCFILVLFLLASCNQQGSESTDEGSDDLVDSINSKTNSDDSAIWEPIVMTDLSEFEDYSQLGFELMKSESFGPLKFDMTEEELLRLDGFGPPEKRGGEVEWGATGMIHEDWYWTSKGVKLNMAKGLANEPAKVFMITLSDHCELKTKRGIGIGSSHEDVWQAYMNEIQNPEDSSTLIAGTIYGGIIFGIEEGKVNSIFLGAAAE